MTYVCVYICMYVRRKVCMKEYVYYLLSYMNVLGASVTFSASAAI